MQYDQILTSLQRETAINAMKFEESKNDAEKEKLLQLVKLGYEQINLRKKFIELASN